MNVTKNYRGKEAPRASPTTPWKKTAKKVVISDGPESRD